VDVDRVIVLCRPVTSSFVDTCLAISETRSQTYGIVKVTRCQRLLHRHNLIWRALDDDLDSLAQRRQLIPDISHASQRLELHKVLVAPLLRVVALGPLLEDIQEREMIATWFDKVLMRLVGVDPFVLRSV
jgi:hypothetical protein